MCSNNQLKSDLRRKARLGQIFGGKSATIQMQLTNFYIRETSAPYMIRLIIAENLMKLRKSCLIASSEFIRELNFSVTRAVNRH